MNVLITSAGQRVSLVRAFQKELKLRYPEGKVYTVDMQPELSAACNISDGYVKVMQVTNPDYISELLELCTKNNVKMVIPTIDTELQVLARYRELFIEKGIHLIVSSLPFVDQCRDKRKIGKFFEEMNIEIPRPVDKHNPEF